MNRYPETIAAPPLQLGEIITARVHRAMPMGGWAEPQILGTGDLVVNTGRIFLAQRIGADVNSPMAHLAVGTNNAGPALANTLVTGEVSRKPLAVNSALVNNIYTAVATWGGSADSVTSLNLQEGGLFNHASSGEGTMFQRVIYSPVILANSDLLSLTLETNVGSNTI